MKRMHTDSVFLLFLFFCLFLSNLHHHVKRAVLRSEPAGFPDKTEDKRRARVENGKCHSAIRCKLKGAFITRCCRGNLGSMGKKPSYLIGGAGGSVLSGWRRSKWWSHKGLQWKSWKCQYKRLVFWALWGAEHEFTSLTSWTPQIWLVSNEPNRKDKWKNIYIFYQTLPLTLKVSDSINIQLQKTSMFRQT